MTPKQIKVLELWKEEFKIPDSRENCVIQELISVLEELQVDHDKLQAENVKLGTHRKSTLALLGRYREVRKVHEHKLTDIDATLAAGLRDLEIQLLRELNGNSTLHKSEN